MGLARTTKLSCQFLLLRHGACVFLLQRLKLFSLFFAGLRDLSSELFLLRGRACMRLLRGLELFLQLLVPLPQLRQCVLGFLDLSVAHLDRLAVLCLQRVRLFLLLLANPSQLRQRILLFL